MSHQPTLITIPSTAAAALDRDMCAGAMPAAVARRPWHERAWLRRAFWAALVAIAVVDGVVATGFRGNAYTCHWSFGLDFRAGDPYRHAGNYYPPGRVMWNAGLTALSYRVSRGLS